MPIEITTDSEGSLDWWTAYNAEHIVDGTLPVSLRETKRQLAEHRDKPPETELKYNKTGLAHWKTLRKDQAFDGSRLYWAYKRTVHQAANLSKTRSLEGETDNLLPGMENRLRNKLKGDLVNLGNMLGEYRKSAALFTGACDKLKELADIRKRGLKAAAQALKKNTSAKKIADAHLAFVYGAAPLAGDMIDSLALMRAAGLRAPSLQATVRRRVFSEEEEKSTYEPITLEYLDVVSNHSILRRESLSAVCEINYDLLMSSLGQTGLTNPFSTAWELIPGSFIIDWWSNIGEVLASLDNVLLFGTITAQHSQKVTYVKRSHVKGASGLFILRSYTRHSPYVMSPINTFVYKPSASKQHILNGLALLASLKG